MATVQTGRDLGHCLKTTDSDRSDAHACIDLYSSYAALDGPHGVDNPCASLQKPVASLLGGVCLNVEHKGSTGEALLVLQVVWTSLVLIVNGSVAFYSRPQEGGDDDDFTGVITDTSPPEYNEKAAKVASKTGGSGKRNRPLKSIYYKEMSS